MAKRKRVIKVVETKTGKVVHEIDVKDKKDAMLEKVMSGLLRNMDTDRFHAVEPKGG